MSEVACVVGVLECEGPRKAIVVGLLPCVRSPERCLEVCDVEASTPPPEVLRLCDHFRVHDRLHAFVVETACLCVCIVCILCVFIVCVCIGCALCVYCVCVYWVCIVCMCVCACIVCACVYVLGVLCV